MCSFLHFYIDEGVAWLAQLRRNTSILVCLFSAVMVNFLIHKVSTAGRFQSRKALFTVR